MTSTAQPDPGEASFDYVPREALRVLIATANGLEIEGTVHLIPGTRLRDLMERGEEYFIAVTEATITDARARERRAPFIAVNKEHVVTIEECLGLDEVGPATGAFENLVIISGNGSSPRKGARVG